MERFDTYCDMPSGMRAYLSNYGWHFSKRMYEFAISHMVDKNGKYVEKKTKEEIDEIIKSNGVTLTYKGYDAPYLYMCAKTILHGDVFTNEQMLCKFVKACIENEYECSTFTRYYADTLALGLPIDWEDVI